MTLHKRGFLALALGLMVASAPAASAAPVKIGYSDWPGWVAWQVPIEKGWIKQAGIDVTFQWFDYVASMDAFAAGKLDGVMMTNGDALVTGSGGGKSVMVLITDYSNGNDMIVAKPGIKSLKELKGKKIGIEVGFVEHLMLLKGMEQNGLTEKDIKLVNTKTNETPQVLGSGQVDAIGAWQPNAGMAMKALPGARPVYTSAQVPGLIYDVIAVSPKSLADNRATYAKLAQIWDRTVKYIKDPKTQPDALKIMSKRVGLTPEEYKPLLAGTYLIDLAEARKVYQKGPGLNSLYGSTKVANDFNVKYGVYKKAENIDTYLDASLTMGK
ncbi:MAG TPA: ABC transporter substrate-binding protein [Rhizomicrobium sp.]|nr:ABC transporter substrate-binding protein [Rhizomicrobium sp.]